MEINDFVFREEHDIYQAVIAGIKIVINKRQMSDDTLSLASKVLAEYPRKADEIAKYIANDDGIMTIYGKFSVNEMRKKLREPEILIIDKFGGKLTYLNHELDDFHIIDIEFSDVLEEFFDLNIDG